MKNKKILYLFSILIIIIMIGLLVYNYINSRNDNNSNNASPTEDKNNIKYDTFSDEKVDILEDSRMALMYTKLNEYADELYKKQEYINYNKNNDIYFISLEEMKDKYNYDITMFVGEDGTVCDTKLSGIYFDIDYKIIPKDSSEDNPPVMPTLIKCSKDELGIK